MHTEGEGTAAAHAVSMATTAAPVDSLVFRLTAAADILYAVPVDVTEIAIGPAVAERAIQQQGLEE